ncbi:P-loop containing nucleoside triphosphate hydrolase protein [Mycena vulgaris]|nr:P-loop containing nucleoside triphosphate hydrolase protein [Mycena vulgaris]
MDQWSIAILGETGVGKTAFVVQFTLNCFTYDPTLEDGYRKQWIVDNSLCYVNVEEHHGPLSKGHRENQGFFLLYSLASRASFDRIMAACALIRVTKKNDDTPIMLLGNKFDLFLDREIQSSHTGWGSRSSKYLPKRP